MPGLIDLTNQKFGRLTAIEIDERTSHGVRWKCICDCGGGRGLDWQLSAEEFDTLTASNCAYCGAEPKSRHIVGRGNGEFIYTGIDRIDNDQGYLADNVVPCCALCNRWKSNLSEDAFYDHLRKIAKYLEL